MILKSILLLVSLAALWILIVLLVNRWSSAGSPALFAPRSPRPPGSTELPGVELTLLTWNIGYAGMGRESDFLADGGSQTRPLSTDLVQKNLAGITERLAGCRADLILLQEVSLPSYTTWSINVRDAVLSARPQDWALFSPDLDTWGLPSRFAVHNGLLTLSRDEPSSFELTELPREPYRALAFRKSYRVTWSSHRIEGVSNELWLGHVHLAAFDDDALVRRAQLKVLIEDARQRFEDGHHVLIGGDWNLRATEQTWPHTTDQTHLFWVHDFPRELVPDGWSLAFPDNHPTVRTAQAPFENGSNYRTVIDGFLCSPNVDVRSVEAIDLAFEFSDHNPVRVHAILR
ncbi:MAG: endonuclease/exonuclease/phosphatase family protein [Planctomycetota bacterium]